MGGVVTVTTDYTSIPEPFGGQQLATTALQLIEVNFFMTLYTALMLNYSLGSPDTFKKVRSVWQPEGQPGWALTDDVCFISLKLISDPYDKMRNIRFDDAFGPSYTTEQINEYTRVWEVSWKHYGPNSFDNARLIWDALYIDYFNGIIGSGWGGNPGLGLYLTDELKTPERRPERYAGQWWERVEQSTRFNELVTSSLEFVGAVTNVPVEIDTQYFDLFNDTIDFVVGNDPNNPFIIPPD